MTADIHTEPPALSDELLSRLDERVGQLVQRHRGRMEQRFAGRLLDEMCKLMDASEPGPRRKTWESAIRIVKAAAGLPVEDEPQAQDPAVRVRALLVERDIWIADLADVTRLDPHQIDAAFKGERRLTSTEVARIAEWAGVSVYWLLGMTEDRHG